VKFVYQYRTSDNARHSGVISAPDRNAAFAELKNRGIRPFAVDEAPGFFNKLLGKGKRWLAIALLAVLAAVLVVLFSRTTSELTTLNAQLSTLESASRRQLIGDAAVMEFGVRTGWASVFTDPGDQFLASFAIPGVPAGKRSVPAELLEKALAQETKPSPDDGLEARQIKSIVGEMKREINGLLANGWTLKEVGSALARRQDEEIACYERAQNELEVLQKGGAPEERVLALWQQRNDQLRKIGVRTLPLPEERK